MYRCTECNAEYETKPQYCDCGNDIFEEIKVSEKEVSSLNSEINQSQPKGHVIEEKEVEIKNKRDEEKVRKPIDKKLLLSLIFCIFCMLLGLYILLFVGNISEDKSNNLDKPVKNDNQGIVHIPSINSLWDDTPAKKVVEIKSEQVKIPENIEEKVLKTPQSKIDSEKKTIVKLNKSVSKPGEQSKNTQVQNSGSVVKTVPASNNKTGSSVSQSSPKPGQTQNKPVQTTQPQTQNTQKKTVANSASLQEVSDYKVKLRNHIARKINFANVVGDGTCVFTFKVNEQGALIEKKFVSTTNPSLSDEVYEALLNVNSYTTPPNGYKPTILRLSVKMYNSNFEVSLN